VFSLIRILILNLCFIKKFYVFYSQKEDVKVSGAIKELYRVPGLVFSARVEKSSKHILMESGERI